MACVMAPEVEEKRQCECGQKAQRPRCLFGPSID